MKRFLLLSWFAIAAQAHVGSPDVFLEGSAGPYPLYVTVRPPSVIPGIAEVEIRSSSAAIRELRVAPVPLTGIASKFAPTPDVMQRSKLDPQFFTGSLWIMAPGSWQVRVQASGADGPGQLSVPVPAVATTTKSMQFALGAILFVMTLVLAFGLVSIVGAGAREGRLDPGDEPDSRSKSHARILMGITAVLVVLILWGGNHWWTAAANGYAGYIYKPLEMSAVIESNNRLVLTLKNPEWSVPRKIDDFLPDHGHLMHLYLLRAPDADRVFHLHPEMTSSGVFTHDLPSIQAGRYQLYGDIVHRSGFPETIVATLTVDHDIAGAPISGDDAAGSRAASADGVHIVWDHDPAPIKARQPQIFKFRMVDKDGAPVSDVELYMGMLGHAAFVKNDGSTFAHVHPSGTVPMAALTLANPASAEDHSMHHMQALPAEADFPYGFPNPGNYRIIVQMKHAGTVETGIFDADVIP